MDPVFVALIQNAPVAGAIILVVVYFLRSIDKIISQFQQLLAEEKKYSQIIFESQREALNLITSHVKQLGDGLMQHDGWERQTSEMILAGQREIKGDVEDIRDNQTKKLRAAAAMAAKGRK